MAESPKPTLLDRFDARLEISRVFYTWPHFPADELGQISSLQLRAMTCLSDMNDTIERVEDLIAQEALRRQVTLLLRMVGAFVAVGTQNDFIQKFATAVKTQNARRTAKANEGKVSKSERTKEIVKRHEIEFLKSVGNRHSTPNHIAERIRVNANIELCAAGLDPLGVDAIANRISGAIDRKRRGRGSR